MNMVTFILLQDVQVYKLLKQSESPVTGFPDLRRFWCLGEESARECGGWQPSVCCLSAGGEPPPDPRLGRFRRGRDVYWAAGGRVVSTFTLLKLTLSWNGSVVTVICRTNLSVSSKLEVTR